MVSYVIRVIIILIRQIALPNKVVNVLKPTQDILSSYNVRRE